MYQARIEWKKITACLAKGEACLFGIIRRHRPRRLTCWSVRQGDETAVLVQAAIMITVDRGAIVPESF